jgi:hypothetical protein
MSGFAKLKDLLYPKASRERVFEDPYLRRVKSENGKKHTDQRKDQYSKVTPARSRLSF